MTFEVTDTLIGPITTVGIWIAALAIHAVRSPAASIVDKVAVVGCLVTLQLLLDLHTRHLGDLVIAGLHAIYGVVVLVGHLRANARDDD